MLHANYWSSKGRISTVEQHFGESYGPVVLLPYEAGASDGVQTYQIFKPSSVWIGISKLHFTEKIGAIPNHKAIVIFLFPVH